MRETAMMKGKPMFFGVKNSRCDERGYTLIDLAMALTIFGLLLSGVATGAKIYMKDKNIAQTREYTRVVANAIENYVLEKGHFPCPASLNKQMASSDYGKAEVCSSYTPGNNNLATAVGPGNFDTAKGLYGESVEGVANQYVVRGMVPFATLNLPEFYAYDAYGNRLQYAVSVNQTHEKGFMNNPNGGGITVVDSKDDAGGASSARRKNHYIVFSSGPGQEGAWSRYGVMVKPCGDGLDGENCNTSPTNQTARYMSARYSLADGAARDQSFDDIVINRSSKHMPMWQPASETGEDIKAVESTARYIVKAKEAGSVAADPANVAINMLAMDVVGEAAVSGEIKSPRYCMHGQGEKCFDPVQLMKGGADSPFNCPSGYMSRVINGKVECTLLSYTCPGHTPQTPKYIKGFDTEGLPVCDDYNFTIGSAPPLVIGSCGNAHQQVMQNAPAGPTTPNLCASGTLNPGVAASGTNTWRWGCEGSGGGRSESCVAYRSATPMPGACGSANGKNYTSKPTTDLCSVTYASVVVTGSGPWQWICSGKDGGANANCSSNWQRNASCGTANGVTVAAPPSNNLCAIGDPTVPAGSNPYTWTCAGEYGGSSANCASGPVTTVHGECGTSNGQNMASQPSSALCNKGTQQAVIDSGSNSWTWTCRGTGIPVGNNASCAAYRIVNGSCGAANGQNLTSAPSSSLCASGNATAVAGSGPWTWSCQGINSGTTANCSANRQVNASCGGSANTCGAGTASGYSAGSCGGNQTWTCNGANGGANASCSLANGPCAVNGSCGGSANTCGSGTASGYSAGSCGGSQTWSCVGAHGGSTASCSIANAACAVGGSCGGSANTCNSGTPSGYNAGSCGGSQTWSCVGSGGGGTANCSIANAACAVGGSCGGSANTCNSGTPSGYNAGSCGGSQTWSCVGSGGGGTANCSIANGPCATNGQCPGAGGAVGSCLAGSFGTYQDSGACDIIQWTCVGSNGGSTATCNKYDASGCGGGGGGGGGCFTGTTEVIMADGTRKPIANLKKGDKVRGHTQTNAVVSNQPYYVRSILYRINDSADAYVTANHPFYTKGGEWKALDAELARKEHPGMEISELKVGDILIHSDGSEVELKSFTSEDHGWLIVYNPSMDGDHTYYANDLLMHNLSQYEQKY